MTRSMRACGRRSAQPPDLDQMSTQSDWGEVSHFPDQVESSLLERHLCLDF